MIWFRRTIAVPLALVFIILSLLVMLAFRVNATAGNPEFYYEQLEKADVYAFIYDEVLPGALREMGGGDSETAGNYIQELEPYLIEAGRETLPPEWLQAQTEQVIGQTVPYVWGETQSINVSIPLKDRVEAGAQALKNMLHEEDVFPVLYDRLLAVIAAEMQPEEEIPLFSALSEEELVATLRTALPADWFVEQGESAIDAIVPYLVMEEETFTVRIDLVERLDSIQLAVSDILKRPEAYDYLFTGLIAPMIAQSAGEITLPEGITLSEEEIVAAMRGALSLEWYQEQVDSIVAGIFDYLRGTKDTIEVEIVLADRKPAIAGALAALADRKLESAVNALPTCSASQLIEMMLDPPVDRLPECRPLDLSHQQLKELLGIDVSVMVAPVVDAMVPDQWVLGDAEIRQLFGGGGEGDMLSEFKDLVQQGLTFTDEDLREMVDAESDSFEETRLLLAEGVTFTEQDLRQWLGGGGGNGSGSLQTFDEVRSMLGTAKTTLNFIWLLPLLLLLGIGVLGGRRWSTKLIWTASVLLLMALVSYVLWGPVFSSLAQPRIDEAMMPLMQPAEGVQGMVAAKGVTIARNAVDSFVGGLEVQSLGLLIGSALLIGAGVFWYYRTREE